MGDQNLLPTEAAARSVGESAPPPTATTTTTPNGTGVPTASAHRGVVGTQPPSLSRSDTGIPGERDRVEPRPPVDVESRTRKQKSPKRHKKRRLSVEERRRGLKLAEEIDFVDASTVAMDFSGLIHQKAPEDKEHSPTSGGLEKEAHCVDSQNRLEQQFRKEKIDQDEAKERNVFMKPEDGGGGGGGGGEGGGDDDEYNVEDYAAAAADDDDEKESGKKITAYTRGQTSCIIFC
ncbi:uncharacterized protein LOC126471005 [Schistocerca serialis cubense]|uniref:uncharacterized protein LOC126471005 n=1 Tax=Schistocerca serialis cubense TaxID=2023355 RepID=UPI00214E4130|nr:uncharacterized protein LOC126471005 [Schistocerca serialis cubense]